jgi:hypothetical protein
METFVSLGAGSQLRGDCESLDALDLVGRLLDRHDLTEQVM